MTSPLLALFVRSLREDSRLKFTYFARSGLVLVLLLFLFMTQATMGWSNAPGLHFFETVAAVNLCFVVLAGVSYFSSAISEEKEEMTLGLLRMTNLNPLSILLGKSTSRLCTALLLFAAQIPFTLLAITLGGVSLRQICAAYAAIAAFLVFVCNLALLASVLCRRTSGAAVLTGVALLFFFLIVPLAGWFGQLPIRLGILAAANSWTETLRALAQFVEAVSPFSQMNKILGLEFHGSAFTFQVGSDLAMGLGLFLLAWAVFEKFCGEQKESAPSRGGVAQARGRWLFFSPGRVWSRALAWKDFHFMTGGWLWLMIKFAAYGAPMVALRCWPDKLGGPPRWHDFGVGTFWYMLFFFVAELAFAAAGIFRHEYQGQTLSSLAMLPQGIRRVAYEKCLGVLPSLAAAGLYLGLSAALVAPAVYRHLERNPIDGPGELLGMVLFAAQVPFLLHLVAALSLHVKRGALPLAIGLYLVLWIFVGLLSSLGGHFGSNTGWILAVTLAATVFLHVHVGRRLETLAAE
jgi:hypothetical protein